MNLLLRRIRAARRRLVLGRFLRHLGPWVFGALAAGALLVWLSRAVGPLHLGPIAAALASLAVAGALATAARRPLSIRTAALALDRAAGSHERILTALSMEVASSPAGEAVIRDAVRLAESLDARSVPLDRPRGLPWLALPLLAGLAGLCIPATAAGPGNSSGAARETAPLPAALRKDQATKLHRRAFDLEKRLLERNVPAAKELAEAMKQTADALRKTEMKPSEAMARISSLEEKLRQRRDELGRNAALAPNLADRRSAGGAADRRAEELSQRLAALDAKLGAAMDAMTRGEASARQKAAMKELADALKGLEGDSLRKLEEMLKAGDESGETPDVAGALEAARKELAELEEALDEWDAVDDELAALEELKDELGGDGWCRRCGARGGG